MTIRGAAVRRALVWTVRGAAAFLVADMIADRRGFSLLDPYFFIPFSCLSAILVGPLLAAKSQTLTRAVLHACAVPAVILALSLALLNLAAPHGIWAFPPWPLLLEAAALSLAITATVAVLTRSLLSRIPSRAVAWGFRAIGLAALLAWRWWPGIQ